MERRRFLQIAGLAGLAIMSPLGLDRGRTVRAGPSKYTGPFWIMVNAGGGWDPTLLCDPKGGTMGDMTSVDQTYTPSQIKTAGGIEYAPVTASVDNIEIFNGDAFWTAHASRLLAINGLDTATNNHDAGSRTVWSGQLAEGYPSFAALVAAVASASLDLPMAFVSNGGYDATEGLIPLARLGSNIGDVQKIAYPNVTDPTKTGTPDYFTSTTASRIAATQQARLQAAQKAAKLPTALDLHRRALPGPPGSGRPRVPRRGARGQDARHAGRLPRPRADHGHVPGGRPREPVPAGRSSPCTPSRRAPP